MIGVTLVNIVNLVTLVVFCIVAGAATAQGYPSKPVRIIVPFAPGGPVDVIARLAAAKAAELLGQQMLVENRPGAGGNTAVVQVARSAADGYTVLATSSSVAVNVTLSPVAGFELERDLIPVVQFATQPNLIVVHPSLPIKNVADLLAYAKSQKPAFASPGSGTTPHLTAENLFRLVAQVELTAIHFKGAGPAATAVVQGEPAIGSLAVTAPLPFVRAGKLRAIAISSAKRHPQLPDVPTLVESGYPSIQDYTWVGFFAPAGTPVLVVQHLNQALNKIMQSADIRERLDVLTFDPVGGTSEQFRDYLKLEIAKWGKVVRDTGAKPD